MEDFLRKLAKSEKYRNIFYSSKELNGINIFDNVSSFSHIQHLFLHYLFFYDIILRDIFIEHISKHVLDCEIYEDAYYYWKNKADKKDKKKDNKEHSKQELSLVFTDTFNKRK